MQKLDDLELVSLNENIESSKSIKKAKNLLKNEISDQRKILNKIFEDSHKFVSVKLEDSYSKGKISETFKNLIKGSEILINTTDFSNKDSNDTIDIILENDHFQIPKQNIELI